MSVAAHDLWSLVESRPQLDPRDLAEGITVQVQQDTDDYRTRLLIHDALEALEAYWGPRFDSWLQQAPEREAIERFRRMRFDEVGFPSLKKRIMDKTPAEKVRAFFEYLGQRVRQTHRLYVGGAVALIVPGYVSRKTEDIDVVGELPQEIRDNHKLSEEMQQIFGLHLGHVQSHYFPSSYADRAHYLSRFGPIEVYLLDVYDVFLSKLFSARVKDMQDMIVLPPQTDKAILVQRLKDTCGPFLATPRLKQLAMDNWKVLFGEDLPS